MTYSNMWRDSLIRVPWRLLSQQADPEAWSVRVFKECSMRVTWRVHMCALTRWYQADPMVYSVPQKERKTEQNQGVYVWHDVFACVTWLTDTCAMTLSLQKADPVVYSVPQKERTTSRRICLAWHIHTCDITRWHVCHDSHFTTGGPSGIFSAWRQGDYHRGWQAQILKSQLDSLFNIVNFVASWLLRISARCKGKHHRGWKHNFSEVSSIVNVLWSIYCEFIVE